MGELSAKQTEGVNEILRSAQYDMPFRLPLEGAVEQSETEGENFYSKPFLSLRL